MSFYCDVIGPQWALDLGTEEVYIQLVWYKSFPVIDITIEYYITYRDTIGLVKYNQIIFYDDFIKNIFISYWNEEKRY